MPRPLVRARTALVAAVVGLAVVLSGVLPAAAGVPASITDAISGTVTDPAGPAAGVTVSVYAQTFGWWSPQAETLTLDDGTYRIGGLEAGVEYRVRFADPAGARTGGYLRDDAGSVSLVADVVNATGVYPGAEGVDVALPLATPITGPSPARTAAAEHQRERLPRRRVGASSGRAARRPARTARTGSSTSWPASRTTCPSSPPTTGCLDGWYRSVGGVASLTDHEVDATSVAAPAERRRRDARRRGAALRRRHRARRSAGGRGPDERVGAGRGGGWMFVEHATTDGSGAYAFGVEPVARTSSWPRATRSSRACGTATTERAAPGEQPVGGDPGHRAGRRPRHPAGRDRVGLRVGERSGWPSDGRGVGRSAGTWTRRAG